MMVVMPPLAAAWSASIGAGVTLGVASFVHYGVSMGDRSVLASDSFLMKGEEMPPGACWGGNPARELPNSDYRPMADGANAGSTATGDLDDQPSLVGTTLGGRR